MASRFELYGAWWEKTLDPLELELECIRRKGRWRNQATKQLAGMGMKFHWKRAQELLWPSRVWHRWAELQAENYIVNKYIAVMGPASAGKSFEAACNVLLDWYCFPYCTTVLVSSTELEVLENRVWGIIKKLHREAKSLHEMLPGHLIESRRRIIYDAKTEAAEGRDFRNGIIAVPTKKGQNYQGLGCFAAGTLIDTPNGPTPIESIKCGDMVISGIGPRRVLNTTARRAEKLVRVNLSNGRYFHCTPEHKIFTEYGWLSAVDIPSKSLVYSPHETMFLLRKTLNLQRANPVLLNELPGEILHKSLSYLQGYVYPKRLSERMLFQELYDEITDVRSCFCSEDKIESGCGCNVTEGAGITKSQQGIYCQDSQVECYASRCGSVCHCEAELDSKTREECKGFWRTRQRAPSDQIRTDGSGCFPGSGFRLYNPYENLSTWKRGMALLQAGYCLAGHTPIGGSGRGNPYPHETIFKGQEERRAIGRIRVDSVQGVERINRYEPADDSRGYQVFNLEVDGHPSYSVEGVVVHNSMVGIHNIRVRLLADELSLMPRVLIDSTANLAKCPNFKCIGIGNPKDVTDSLGVLAEPAAHLGGWEGGIDQSPGTKTWETKFPKGVCIQLPGSDTPNKETEPGKPWKYPFLINPDQIEEDKRIWGSDSLHFTMMNEGKMPRGQSSRRVLTRQDCLKFHAFEEVQWKDNKRTRIAGLDAAYRGVGGDRCVFGEIQFGEQAEPLNTPDQINQFVSQKISQQPNKVLLALIDLIIVPVNVSPGNDLPEDQIARFCMKECENRSIPPENFFFDSTGRGSLASAFGRIWSPQVVGIEFGGSPSDQMVSADIDINRKDYYFNMVTELWYDVRLAVEAEQVRGMTEELVREFSYREWGYISKNKIQVEPKDLMKQKSGRSPDLADMFAVAIKGAQMRGFRIVKNVAKNKPTANEQRWKREVMEQARRSWQQHQLEYAP